MKKTSLSLAILAITLPAWGADGDLSRTNDVVQVEVSPPLNPAISLDKLQILRISPPDSAATNGVRSVYVVRISGEVQKEARSQAGRLVEHYQVEADVLIPKLAVRQAITASRVTLTPANHLRVVEAVVAKLAAVRARQLFANRRDPRLRP